MREKEKKEITKRWKLAEVETLDAASVHRAAWRNSGQVAMTSETKWNAASGCKSICWRQLLTGWKDATNKQAMLSCWVEPAVDRLECLGSNGSGNSGCGGCVLPCVGHVIFKLDATMIDGFDIAQWRCADAGSTAAMAPTLQSSIATEPCSFIGFYWPESMTWTIWFAFSVPCN